MTSEEKQASFAKQLKKRVSARSISPPPIHAELSPKTLVHSRSAKALESTLSMQQSLGVHQKHSGSNSQLLNSSHSAHRRLYSPTAKELLENMIALEQTENFFKQFEPLKRKAKPLEKSVVHSGSQKGTNHTHSTSTVITSSNTRPRLNIGQAHTESLRSGLKRSGSPGLVLGSAHSGTSNPLGLHSLNNLSQMKSSTRNLLNNQHLLGIFKNLG